MRKVTFNSSALLQGTKRSRIGVAVAVAFLTSGRTWAEYSETLQARLGVSALTDKPYADIMEICAPHVEAILNEMMEHAKNNCRQTSADNLGSSRRLVVTSDGVWGTRGFHSANGSFLIVDYFKQGLLWKGHASQKGRDTEELYHGTSRSMEAYLALQLFEQAREEEFNIEVVWQVNFHKASHFPETNIICFCLFSLARSACYKQGKREIGWAVYYEILRKNENCHMV